jgi:hypothetical protein
LVFEEDVGVDVAVAQRGQGPDLFGVELAAVSGQRDGAEAVADGAERAPGLDLGQLARVADADELAAGSRDVLGEAVVGARADHPGLVDEEHRLGRQAVAAVDVGQQARGVHRAYPCLRLERPIGWLPLAMPGRPSLDDIAARERRPVLGDPLRA